MKTSRESFTRTRRTIIETAGRLFVEKGFSNVGIAEIMNAAGLTHGGFYGHFDSKSDLAHEATKQLFLKYEERWRSVLKASPESPLSALLASYFSSAESSQTIARCILNSLSQEAGQSDSSMRGVFSDGVRALLQVLEEAVPTEVSERRMTAMATLSSMVGAATLAAAIDDADLANEIVSSVGEGVATVGGLSGR